MYEWCTDHAFTPYVAVKVDGSVQVPREFVQDGEIVLNISFDATSSLQLGNEFIEFKARFGGKPRDIMSFPVSDAPLNTTVLGMDKLHKVPDLKSTDPKSTDPKSTDAVSAGPDSAGVANPDDKPVPPSSPRPTLTRVK
jgi:stringent starvation protein B